MAPTKRGNGEPTDAAVKAVASQRTIASFFESKLASSALKKSPRKKTSVLVPSEDGQPPPQSGNSKRARLMDVKKPKGEGPGSEPKTVSISPGACGEGKRAESSEPDKSVMKCLGRRDRKASKSAVVMPVLSNSTSQRDRSSVSVNTTESPNPGSLIGKRLKVYWPKDKAWYAGHVKSYNKARASHVVRYDDSEEESLILEREEVKWISEVEEWRSSAAKEITKLSPPVRKRKNLKDVDGGTLLNELKNGQNNEVQSETLRMGKRSRLDAVEEDSSDQQMIISSDIYDEIDIPVPQEEEVKVRRRLKKKVEKNNRNTQEAEVESKAGKKGATSAVGVQLDGAVECHEKRAALVEALDEKLGSPDKIVPPDLKKTCSASIKLPTKTTLDIEHDGLRRTFLSRSTACPPKDSSKTGGVKSVKTPEGALLVVSSEISKWSKDLDADKLMGLQLHSTLTGEAAERFDGRVEEKFKFLGKGRRDASGRRPSDPAYDNRTVLLPSEFLKELSGGQRQWWEFKSKHMDKVLLFKMGKFYEMFEMDAHVGAQELDLQYMKGNQPHCGFPEKLYSECAEKLARKGYRVLVVEQTETPDQLEKRRRETGTKDKVVKREVCAVLTKGTIVDGEMLVASPDAAYLMSVTELTSSSSLVPATPGEASVIGICFVDASTSHIMLGQFVDDAARSKLRMVLSERRPVEVIKPRSLLSEATEHAIKDHSRQPLVNCLTPGKEFWDAKQSLKEIMEVFTTFKSSAKLSGKSRENAAAESDPEEVLMLPQALQTVIDAGNGGEAALSALGGCIFYLRTVLLDRTLLRLGRIDLLPGSDSFSQADSLIGLSHQAEPKIGAQVGDRQSESDSAIPRGDLEPYMLLDSAALENLEILENNRDGGASGSLLAHLDTCVTPYGRRLLRQWLVRPLTCVGSILQRQQALVDLKGEAAEAATSFRKELVGQPDMERLLARLHACSGSSGRNAGNVVLYEDAAKKQLQEFLWALHGCRALIQALKYFEGCLCKLTSTRLKQLVTPVHGVSDMTSIIEHFETIFDHEEAEKTGRIVPLVGVDESFDEADSAVKDATEKLNKYLADQRQKFGNSSEITYVTVGKEAYQMEIPEKFHAKIPSSYEVRSSRKGFRRYWTPEIKEHLRNLAAGEQRRELVLRGILQGLVKDFCENYSKWLNLVKYVAEVDVLISLSEASIHSAPTCRPRLADQQSSSDAVCTQKIVAKGIRHPTVSVNLAGGGTFVPNDVTLGGNSAPLMVLTGPNMGGKSTLIRQVCLAVVLAQVGANVTADQFELSPVDKLFVRMGAKDNIMAGQSTFLVELSETASMLRSATGRSLVALDELGRGTSTSDGQAIAHSVLQHLAQNIGCRGMFSTHYHRLAAYFASNPKVGLYHMSCKVGTGIGSLEEVIFLYKLAAGACPKSYGVNVARLAGIPEAVLQRAAEGAVELEFLSGKISCSKSEESESAAPVLLGPDGLSSGREPKAKLAKEAICLLEKLPTAVESDVGFDALLQVWEAAKQMFQTCVE